MIRTSRRLGRRPPRPGVASPRDRRQVAAGACRSERGLCPCSCNRPSCPSCNRAQARYSHPGRGRCGRYSRGNGSRPSSRSTIRQMPVFGNCRACAVRSRKRAQRGGVRRRTFCVVWHPLPGTRRGRCAAPVASPSTGDLCRSRRAARRPVAPRSRSHRADGAVHRSRAGRVRGRCPAPARRG